MLGFLASSVLSAVACAFPTAATADFSPEERTTIDQIIGGKGAYSADDGAYKVVFPREAATFFQDFQKLSPNLGLNSWVTFSSAVHQESILAGQFLLLEDEVNPVLTVALEAGLPWHAHRCFTVRSCIHSMCRGEARSEIWPQFRKGLEEIRRVRRNFASGRTRWTLPAVPIESAIDGGPLDAVLSMGEQSMLESIGLR